jgi:hypothetical protein
MSNVNNCKDINEKSDSEDTAVIKQSDKLTGAGRSVKTARRPLR